jgi:hypothetical protein
MGGSHGNEGHGDALTHLDMNKFYTKKDPDLSGPFQI